MRVFAAGLAAAAALSAAALSAGAAQAAEPSVSIKDAIARVTVVPQDRADIKVVIQGGDSRLPLRVYTKGDRTIVDGDLRWNRIRNCRGGQETASVDVRNLGTIAWSQMPHVTIYTPRNVKVGAGGAVWGAIGRASSVSLSNAGCGDWTIANVSGALSISQAGSGDVRAGDAGGLDLSVAGSGDTRVKAVTGEADISIAGSGNVVMASLTGDLDVSIAGSGDVRIHGGQASSLDVSVTGSGDVRFAGEAQRVDASFVGSGDVWVTKAGSVQKSAVGSGSIHVGPFNMTRD